MGLFGKRRFHLGQVPSLFFGPGNGLHVRWWEWEEIQFLPCVLFLVLSFECWRKKMIMMKMAVKSVYSQSVSQAEVDIRGQGQRQDILNIS